MRVLLVNGSPNKRGCTYTALREVGQVLEQQGIETEVFQLGNRPVYGCIACEACRNLGRCAFDDDPANACAARMAAADAVVVGSPVYYASANGALCAMLDRVFYAQGGAMRGKPAAAVVSCRRSGGTAAFDRLNKYFTLSQMPVVSSQYWNVVHGNTPEEVRQDLEGMQIMRTLGHNLAHMLRSLERAGLPLPEQEPRVGTNFIR